MDKPNAANSLSLQLKELYDRAGIPTIELQSIERKISRLISKMKALNKYSHVRQSANSYIAKVNSFKQVFDVCMCISVQLQEPQLEPNVTVPRILKSLIVNGTFG